MMTMTGRCITARSTLGVIGRRLRRTGGLRGGGELHNALGERPDGKWAAFEVGIEVPRQNGKGGILEAFGLAGLFLLGERLIIHSAHEFATAEEALERMAQILEASPDLSRRVKTFKRSHGQEGIYLRTVSVSATRRGRRAAVVASPLTA
jgi:hypothetical protein